MKSKNHNPDFAECGSVSMKDFDASKPDAFGALLTHIAQQMIDTKDRDTLSTGLVVKHEANAIAAAYADLQRQDFDNVSDVLHAIAHAQAIVLSVLIGTFSGGLRVSHGAVKAITLKLVSDFSQMTLKNVAANTGAFSFEALVEGAMRHADMIAREHSTSVPVVKAKSETVH